MKQIFFGLIGIVILPISSAQAGIPQKFSVCESKMHIRYPADSAGVYFDEKCTAGFVLPPKTGSLHLAAVAPNAMLRICPAFDSVLNAIDNEASALEAATRATSTSEASDPFAGGPLAPAPATQGPMNHGQDLSSYLSFMTRATKELDQFKSTEAATAQVIFDLQWSKMLSEFAALNPSISFQKLALDLGKLSFIRKTSPLTPSLDAALSVEIPGLSSIPLAGPESVGSKSETALFGESLSGQLVLSLAGACPLINSSFGGLVGAVDPGVFGAYFAANLQYKASVQAKRSYTAKYNLARFAQQIQSQTTNGGFFSTSTNSSEQIVHNSSAWLDIKFESEDQRLKWGDEVRVELINRLLNEVVKEVAAANGVSVPLPTILVPGKDGASVGADELQKCPDMYCQIGAASLRFLDAAFGSTAATTNFINSQDFERTETVTDSQMEEIYGTATFEAR